MPAAAYAGHLALFLFIVFLIYMFLRVPVPFALLLTSLTYILVSGRAPAGFITQGMTSALSKYSIICSPFFIVVGYVMNYSGVTDEIFNFADCLVGHIKGGLGHVNVLASLIFAGMSGSANADASGLGNIEIKAMKDRGFDADFAVGVTAASSVIGPIFPPSNPMVFVGIIAGVSIGALFLAGTTVGILLTLALCIMVYLLARKKNYPVRVRATPKEILAALRKGVWALLSPVIILYCISSGVVTPTECGAVAILYSLFISIFIYKSIKFKDLYRIITPAINAIGLVLMLVAAGNIYAWLLGDQQVAAAITNFLFSLTDNPWVILLLINLFLLFLGMFMESVSAITIAAPLLFPLAVSLGLNPVHFGIIFVLNLMIGVLTPPMAICLFITSKLGEISFERAWKATRPYYISLLVVLLLVNLFPVISLFMPNLLLKGYSW